MGALRLLFAPELARSLTDAARSSAELFHRMGALRVMAAGGASANAGQGDGKEIPATKLNMPKANSPRLSRRKRISSLMVIPILLSAGGFIGAVLAGLSLTEPAAAQTIDRGLFADADRATRDVLAFLGDIGKGRNAVLGDMLFVFNAGVLALAGFLLVWHTVAGTLDTAREGRFGFGAWEIVRIVTAIALMAPLPGGMNGAQHAVIGLAHLGGDFANAVWKPFSEEALGAGKPIAPRPREAVWRAAISQNPDSGDLPLCRQRQRRPRRRCALYRASRGTRGSQDRLEPPGFGVSRPRSSITTAPGAACRAISAAGSASPGSGPRARLASPRRGTAMHWRCCCPISAPSPPISPPIT